MVKVATVDDVPFRELAYASESGMSDHKTSLVGYWISSWTITRGLDEENGRSRKPHSVADALKLFVPFLVDESA
jgi:hypothetical protein